MADEASALAAVLTAAARFWPIYLFSLSIARWAKVDRLGSNWRTAALA
jgi:hypothetical protein